ncbi:MAG: 4-hydroxy-tetrahydrodipicolinate reductase, partial [Oscillospiraceae bacterium]|nr:4-hydroxy-tetrahydrodipicolinate reductase [Oscillospiraceae bacterium]
MGTKILISGCNGHMGKVVAQELENRKNAQVVAGIDLTSAPCKFPVYSNPINVAEKVDVIIDFSNPAALSSLLTYAKAQKIPVVFCTTGY